MFNKRLFALLALSSALVACGGKDDKDLTVEYGVVVAVNGSVEISDVTRDQVTVGVDQYGLSFEACTKIVNSIEVPMYDNYNYLDPGYCDQTRTTLNAGVSFKVMFVNNTYEDMPLTYTGRGVVIHIYDDSDTEVWNSIIQQDQIDQAYGRDPFDPFAEHSIILGPAETYPRQDQVSLLYSFTGDQNYSDYDGDPGTYNLQDDFVGLQWVQGSDAASECDPVSLKDANADGIYERPVCQTIALPAGVYHVLIEFSFIPAAHDPVEFDITINPET